MASTQQIKARIKTVKNTNRVVAFIDAANLHTSVENAGWKIDYARFRVWLEDKLGVSTAYMFIGLVQGNERLYQHLQEAGFVLVFKQTVSGFDGTIKGNCDADMVLKIVSGAYEATYDSAVLVTSDGDFYSTVDFLSGRQMIDRVISPSRKCSILLKQTGVTITYIDDIRARVERKKKRPPLKTEQQQGSSRGNVTQIIDNKRQKVNKGKR